MATGSGGGSPTGTPPDLSFPHSLVPLYLLSHLLSLYAVGGDAEVAHARIVRQRLHLDDILPSRDWISGRPERAACFSSLTTSVAAAAWKQGYHPRLLHLVLQFTSQGIT